MRTPFKISFKEEITGTPNKTILENFKANFSDTFCDHILINSEKELVVKNDRFHWKPDQNWNLWLGIKKALVTINENADKKKKTIKYSIDFTSYIFISLIIIVLFPLFHKLTGLFSNPLIKYITIFWAVYFVIMLFISVLRHRSIFKRTLKFGTVNYPLGNYDWDTIIKNMTDLELQEVISGRKRLPETVVGLAKTELERRSKNK
jgi:hypothetical protein